jgi:hypothetical protein
MPGKSPQIRRLKAGRPPLSVAGLLLANLVLCPARGAEPESLTDVISTEPEADPPGLLKPDRRAVPVPMASNGPAKSAATTKVLVLFDGRVIGGTIEEGPSGYRLTRRDGFSETIPAAFVRVAADSLEAAYQTMRDSIRAPLPNEHVELAEWCIKQGLYVEAEEQLGEALRLDPNRRDARDLLRTVDSLTRRKPIHAAAEDPRSRTDDGFEAAAPRTATDLSREAMATFVRRTQPLLLNKCGNASCHGSKTTTEFQLTAARGGTGPRATTLANLDMILSRINAGSVASSPLLESLSSDAHQRVFSGAAGKAQRTQLEAWLKQAAGVSDAGGEKATPSFPDVMAAMNVVVEEPPIAGGLKKAARPPQLKPVEESDVVKAVLESERPDPFDPDAFNRAVHGAAARP